MLDAIFRRAILTSQHTLFRGAGGYSSLPLEKQSSATPTDKAAVEAADYPRFFKFFRENISAELSNKRILDFGSGYGGRTVAYAQHFNVLEIVGVEVTDERVTAGRDFANREGVASVEFRLASQNRIPAAADSFDVVVSYDVLEHVQDPRVSLREIARILKPGGKLFAVFPLYRGMFSHHLDYITRLPGLHLIFGPDRIMRVVTATLDGPLAKLPAPRFGPPIVAYTGRKILPTLNGMGETDFLNAVKESGLTLRRMERNSVGSVFGGKLGSAFCYPFMKMPRAVSEIFTLNIAATLIRE